MTKEEKRAKNKARYERLKQEHKCVECGKDVDAGQLKCPECQQKAKEAYRKRREKLKSAGKCVICGKPAIDGQTRCETCRDRQKAYHEEIYALYIESRVCVKCHKEQAENGYTMCLQCRMDERERNSKRERTVKSRKDEYQKSKQKRDERQANGQCPLCGRKMTAGDTHYSCKYCRAQASKTAKARRAAQGVISDDMRGNGIYCAVCRKPVEHIGDKICERCKTNSQKNIEKAHENRPQDNYFKQMIATQWRRSELNAIKYGRKVG